MYFPLLPRLYVRENKASDVCVVGLTETRVDSVQEVVQVNELWMAVLCSHRCLLEVNQYSNICFY